MTTQEARRSALYDRTGSTEFYEDRYAQGYMDEWPIEKKQRVFEIIRSLDLPPSGEAIDFGCGNGVFTSVVRQALPATWTVYGTDISTIAIENATRRYPNCRFFVLGDPRFASRKFDFLFSHHVLEHVYDLNQVLGEMNGVLSETGRAFHILPCGNEGSFEHAVTLLRTDGVDPGRENRFFFEDEGHLRRLTTAQLSDLYARSGFALRHEFYSNQYYGALDWITQSGRPFVELFTGTDAAVDARASARLKRIRRKLLLLCALRFPSFFWARKRVKHPKNARDYRLMALGLPFVLATAPVDRYIRRKALEEWQRRKSERNGSEMYLCFDRRAPAAPR